MQVLRAEHRPTMPWKNGGGRTAEVAVSPPGAGLDDFDWRISLADLDRAGPFSAFAGVDRILAMIAGHLDLTVNGETAVRLSPDTEPFHFPGEWPVSGDPVGCPAMDINVMVRRGRYEAKVERVHPGRLTVGARDTETIVLVALRTCGVGIGAELDRLSELDALVLEPGETAVITGEAPTGGALVATTLRRLRADHLAPSARSILNTCHATNKSR